VTPSFSPRKIPTCPAGIFFLLFPSSLAAQGQDLRS